MEGSSTRLTPADGPLTPLQRYALFALALTFVLFGGLFEFRSAFLQNRKGDLNVFLRAAWAVRTGEDIYAATDDNDHHYHYPPFLAIMLVPLADAPAGRAPLPGMLPYSVSVATWYVLSLLLLFLALDTLANAVEWAMNRRPAMGSQRWWALRIVPLLACLPAIGGALMRGQVDMILLALFCGMIACAMRGKSAAAGLLLAAAISIKVIPAFLLLYPLWKRDTRWLTSCGVGLAVFLIVIPVATFGPQQTVRYYREWDERVLRPGLTEEGDQTRAEELTQVTATDSQSFLAVLHNWHYPVRPRPALATAGERLSHWALGGLFTAITLALATRAARRTAEEPLRRAVFLAALLLVMILTSPVCHLHYFSLAIPVTMMVLAASWQARHDMLLSTGMWALFAFNIVANAVPRLPGCEWWRDHGLASLAALTLWACACAILWKSACLPGLVASPVSPTQPRLAA